MKGFNRKDAEKYIKIGDSKVRIFSLPKLEKCGFSGGSRLPYAIKVLLESAIRNFDGHQVTVDDIKRLCQWSPKNTACKEIAFKPGRVILQDFTGVPCVVDLAAMRSALKRIGGDYRRINPQVACDLVIDHSLQVDAFASKEAFGINIKKEFERNKERYAFLKWGQSIFKNFRVVPPATGIIHQVNLEYLAKGVLLKKDGKSTIAFPDSLVGTDSHTTMINGIGVVGWGVGGIEAEAVMLGEPIYMLLPEVVGFNLKGRLRTGVTATDLVLTVTQILRKKGVVGKFVEFFGNGLSSLSLPDRATIANMAPEYGATMGLFPVDKETLHYYKMTGRKASEVALIERYTKEQGMFYSPSAPLPEYTETIELELETIEPCLAGPKRPQDRIALNSMKKSFRESLTSSIGKMDFGVSDNDTDCFALLKKREELRHGSVVIAAITSCTNTSNPSVLIGAGLLAKKASESGLTVKGFVKTSFAPGSRVATEYLKAAKLLPYLEKLGFHVVGYGCTTCIGNSGPLSGDIDKAIKEDNLVVASVSSGNRNFEGRIHPLTKVNYLASPPLVVAYALAGTVDIDFDNEPIGIGKKGEEVFLKDIWPTEKEANKLISKTVTARLFRSQYKDVFSGNCLWEGIKKTKSDLYKWTEESTYIQEPPFFIDMKEKPEAIKDIKSARVLVLVGDSITTDHISPAGPIAVNSPAGQYLLSRGVRSEDFNSYGSRRGNDLVMTRGTFANIRLRNLLASGTEGSWTVYLPNNEKMSIFDAAQLYKKDKTSLVVLAGNDYGMGSSRDWAAKGTALLGVRVVLARSFERIHRSNLVGMGVLPLEFKGSDSIETLQLSGKEILDFVGLKSSVKPRDDIKVIATSEDGKKKEFLVTLRLDTPVEIEYYCNGGILQTVLRKLSKSK